MPSQRRQGRSGGTTKASPPHSPVQDVGVNCLRLWFPPDLGEDQRTTMGGPPKKLTHSLTSQAGTAAGTWERSWPSKARLSARPSEWHEGLGLVAVPGLVPSDGRVPS